MRKVRDKQKRRQMSSQRTLLPTTVKSDMPKRETSETEEETRSFLISLPIFSSFNVDEIALLSRHMSYIHLQRGEHLFLEGDQGTFMGFVVQASWKFKKELTTVKTWCWHV